MSGITDIGTQPTSTRVGAIRDTGFPEPLSEHRNTTVPHPDGASKQEVDDQIMAATKAHRHNRLIPGHHKTPKDIEREMYAGLETVDAEEIDGEEEDDKHRHDGAVKKVLHKLSCGAV